MREIRKWTKMTLKMKAEVNTVHDEGAEKVDEGDMKVDIHNTYKLVQVKFKIWQSMI